MDIRRVDIPGKMPPPEFPDKRPDFSRIEGMLLGLAIGDSLGNTSESMLPSARFKAHGEIRDYLPNIHVDWRAVGLPSDDTQLSFWTIGSILEQRAIDPEILARIFSSRRIFGLGRSVRQFIANFRSGTSWQEAGVDSAGNGALMRTAPLVLPSLLYPGADLVRDLYLGSRLTHDDSASISSCIAFGIMLRDLLVCDRPPNAGWWPARFIRIAREAESEKRYPSRDPASPYPPATISGWVEQTVTGAIARGMSSVDACNSWRSGAYLPETVPSALYILARYGHDPEEAIIRAVNDTHDNDTIASIVGAAVGALHGVDAIPDRWKQTLAGRTGMDDDGEIQRIISALKREYAGCGPGA